jgi:hypothetical protein
LARVTATQVARNVTDVKDGLLRSKRYLLLDRDTKYSDAFGGSSTARALRLFGCHAVGQYLCHYHRERNHQGLGNQLLIPSRVMGEPGVPVKRRERLGGMLSYYNREAA